MKDQWQDKEKSEARTQICRRRCNKAYKHILMLPSSTALDIEELLAQNAIRPGYTTITAIERDEKTADKLDIKLKSLGFPYEIVRKELTDTDLAEIVKRKPRIDFAYIDTCSFLTEEMIKWLLNLSKTQYAIFSDKATMVLAFCHFVRNSNELMRDFIKFSSKTKYSSFSKFKDKKLDVREIGKFKKDSEFRFKSFITLNNILYCMFDSSRESIQYLNQGSTMVMSTFEYCVNDCSSSPPTEHIEEFLEYRDKTKEKTEKDLLKEKLKKIKTTKILKYEDNHSLKDADIETQFRRCLAGWRAAANRFKDRDDKRVLMGVFEFVQGLSTSDREKIANLFSTQTKPQNEETHLKGGYNLHVERKEYVISLHPPSNQRLVLGPVDQIAFEDAKKVSSYPNKILKYLIEYRGGGMVAKSLAKYLNITYNESKEIIRLQDKIFSFRDHSGYNETEWKYFSKGRQAILDLLEQASEPLGPKEIATHLNMKEVNIRELLRRMYKSKAINKESRGKYTKVSM